MEETKETVTGPAMRHVCNYPPPAVYHYSGHYTSGAVVLSEIVGWKSDWETRSDRRHTVFTKTGISHLLDDGQIREFEQEYRKWVVLKNMAVAT